MPDTYTSTISVAGYDPGEALLTVFRNDGNNCPPVSAVYKNITPFDPFGCTTFRLYPEPIFDSYYGFYPPCELKVIAYEPPNYCATADSDVSVTGSNTPVWEPLLGSSLYLMLDESDSTYIRWDIDPLGGFTVARFSIQDKPDPLIHTDHSIVFRARQSAPPGDRMGISINVYDTTVGTSPIAAQPFSSITDEWTDYTLNFTEAQAASIASYDDLEVAIIGTRVVNNGEPRQLQVSSLCFNIPAPVEE